MVFCAWLALNVALNLALPSLLNQDPDRLRVRFAWAWALRPDRLNLHGLEVRGQGRRDQWVLTVRRASGDVDVSALRHRTFRADNVEAVGASFRYRLRGSAASDAVPPIAGLPVPPLPELVFERDTRGPWTVELPDAVIHDVEEIWIENHRLVGEAGATGSLHLADEVSFDAKLEIADGALIVGGDPAAGTVSGLVTATSTGLPRFVPLGAEALGKVSAVAKLRAEAADLRFLDVYLAGAPWLDVSGPAHLDIDAALDRGHLRPGSHLLGRAEALQVGLRSYTAEGSGLVWLEVDEDDPEARTRIAVQLGDYVVRAAEQREALVVGRGLHVLVTSPDVALNRALTSVRVAVDLPESELRQVAHLGAYLPRDTGIGIVGGTGRIRGRLVAESGDEPAAHGEVVVEGRDLAGTWDALRIETDATLHARLSGGDLAAGRFDFAGTRLVLTRLGVFDPAEDDPAETPRTWWATVDVPRGTLRVGEAPRLDADLMFRCADSAPIVDLVAQRRDLAGWVQDLLSIPDVSGRAGLEFGADRLGVRELAIEAGRGAELKLDLDRVRRESRGALFAKLGPMAVGVEFDPGRRRLHVVNPRRWYDAHVLAD